MRRFGLLNLQHIDNYGAVLVGYAVQTLVQSITHERNVYTIDYRPELLNVHKQQTKLQKVMFLLHEGGPKAVKQQLANRAEREKRRQNFEIFRKKHLRRTPICTNSQELVNAVSGFDFEAYIVGSDVVWKPLRVQSPCAEDYFLGFAGNSRTIAYAASIGTSDEALLDSLKPHYNKGLQNIDYISIREKRSIPFLSELTSKPISVCLDPTLLLEKEAYKAILTPELRNATYDYIYVYSFESIAAFRLAERLSRETGLKILCRSDLNYAWRLPVEHVSLDGPAEFLARIHNAQFVITDSFHATVFSVLFERKFIVAERGNLTIRMQNLLEMLEIPERLIHNENQDIPMEPYDVQRVNTLLNEAKKKSLDFLTEALEGQLTH